MLVLTSIILSTLLHWQHLCYQRIRQQNSAIQQQGMTVVSTLIGLLLMSLSLLALTHISISALQTERSMDDLIQQNRTAILFYFTMQPYLARVGYIGCNSKHHLKQTPLQLYFGNDVSFPDFIRRKSLARSQVLWLNHAYRQTYFLQNPSNNPQKLSLDSVDNLHVNDVVIVNNCEQVELHRVTNIDSHAKTISLLHPIKIPLTPIAEIHRFDQCWFFIAKTTHPYPNHKPMQALYRQCDHEPLTPVLLGIESWQMVLRSHAVDFEFHTESSLSMPGQLWHRSFTLENLYG